MEKSHVSLQAQLSKSFLQKRIEKEIQNLIGRDGISLPLPQGELVIERIEHIKYEVSSQAIQLAADIEVEYNKDKGISVEGHANVHLLFNIDYTILPDLTLATKTCLKNHEWIEKPSIKVGKLSIPSKVALDLLINTFDDEFGKRIDNIISKKLDLQKVLTEQLTKLENPIPNPLDKNIHLFIHPNNLLFNIRAEEVDYALSVHTSFDAEVKWEKLPNEKIFSALPHIEEYDGTPTMSKLNVPVKVNYKALSEHLVNQFAQVSVMGRSLQVKDIVLRYDDRLHIKAKIEGDFVGTLDAQTSPRLDASTQTVYLDQLEYDLTTHNILVKAAAFLFKGEINKRLDQFSKVPLKPIIAPLIKNLNAKLTEFKIEGLDFSLHLDSLDLNDLRLYGDHLLADVEVKANQILV